MRFVPFLLMLAAVGMLAACDDDSSTSTDPGKPPCAPCAVIIGADMDNTLYENAADTSNGAGYVMIAGLDGRRQIRRGLIHIDLSSIPAGSRIDSVQVRLTTVTFNGTTVTVGLHRALSRWGEGTSAANCDVIPCADPTFGAPATPGDATWFKRLWPDTLWTNPGGDYVANASSSTTVAGTAFWTWRWRTSATIVSDVQGWLDDPSSNYGWVIIGDESSTGTHKWFGTHEMPQEDFRPEIVIHYSD